MKPTATLSGPTTKSNLSRGSSSRSLRSWITKILTFNDALDRSQSLLLNDEIQLKSFEWARASSGINNWLDSCLSEHSACRISNQHESSFLPTRLIFVGSLEGHNPPRLVDTNEVDISELTKELPTRHGHTDYATLSYCWGTGLHSYKTTIRNVGKMKREISWITLPKTIQHAILLCRKLSIHFIWIDALCIVQSSPHGSSDWEFESMRMNDYYKHSVFTIAAAEAKENTDGFLRFDSPREHRISPFPIEFPPTRNPTEQLPLLRRAWVLQELTLSPRIVYFTNNCIYWECLKLLGSEVDGCTAPHVGTSGASNFHHSHNIKMRLLVEPKASPLRWLAVSDNMISDAVWLSLVKRYLRMSLTYSNDVFPAISGLAQEYAKQSKGRYLAGLWERSLSEGLSWYHDHQSPVQVIRKSTAPSWSWASATTCIDFAYFTRLERGIPATDWDVPLASLVSADLAYENDNEFGPIKNGEICLRGRIVNIKYNAAKQRWTCLGFPVDLLMYPDQEDRIYLVDGLSFKALVLMSLRRIREPGGEWKAEEWVLLLLEKSFKKRRQYRRIGIGTVLEVEESKGCLDATNIKDNELLYLI